MIRRLLAATTLVVLLPLPASADDDPVVRAVLFFSPTCGHCEYVINGVLPGVFAANGGDPRVVYDTTAPTGSVAFWLVDNGTLQMLLVDVTIPAGRELFIAAGEAFDIGSSGVPRLVVGEEWMIGSVDIPERFPHIVSDALTAGTGIDWPDIPGLDTALATMGMPAETTTTTGTGTAPTNTTTPQSSTSPPLPLPLADESPWQHFGRDPVANGLAVAVLLVVISGGAGAVRRFLRPPAAPARPRPVPYLALFGLVVAGYLAAIEMGGGDAVCGPVGDCVAVQQSEYARLFGVPIGVIGVAGYLGMLLAWIGGCDRPAGGDRLPVAGFTLALGGTAFSAYLTFLEPFVIGASCAWCLSSALTVTAIAWTWAPAAGTARRRLSGSGRADHDPLQVGGPPHRPVPVDHEEPIAGEPPEPAE